MTLNCPKCSTPMDSKTIGKIVVDHCPGCSGIWFDEGELQHGLAEGGREDLKKLSVATPSKTALDTKPANCPRCASEEVLLRVASPGREDLHIDACTKCGGVWYDGGEVDDLLEDGVGRKIGKFVKGLFG